MYRLILGLLANVAGLTSPAPLEGEKEERAVAMTLGRRIAVLVVTALMALMMVAGPVASVADADGKPDGGKNNGWGDGTGGGKGHPKKDGGCQVSCG